MNRIRELRQLNQWTQDELAEKISVVKSVVSRYENEQLGLDTKTILKLCDIFGVTSDYLLCRSSSPTASMTDEEAALLRAYRAADDRARAVVNLTLEPFTEQAGNATATRRKNNAAR